MLGVFPVPWSSRWSWSLHLFFGRPMFLRLFGLYFSACFGILFASILCTCCSQFFWYFFISFTMFCAPVFSLIHWFFLYLILLFQLSVSKISSVLLLNVVPLSSSVLRLHFQIVCCQKALMNQKKIKKSLSYKIETGYVVVHLVEALLYKPGRSQFRLPVGLLTNPSDLIVVLVST